MIHGIGSITKRAENLSIQYSDVHTISVDIPTLFNEVAIEGHGRYCMPELTVLFAALIKGLGSSSGTKVRTDQRGEANRNHWTGWS